MVACTFNGIIVHSYHVDSMSAKGAYSFECTLACRTGNYSDITTLVQAQDDQGLIGIRTVANGKTNIQCTKGDAYHDLVLNGVTYPKCFIKENRMLRTALGMRDARELSGILQNAVPCRR